MRIKYKGMTLRVRPLEAGETISDMCLCRHRRAYSRRFMRSECVGSCVDELPDWEYVEVQSKFFQPTATD